MDNCLKTVFLLSGTVLLAALSGCGKKQADVKVAGVSLSETSLRLEVGEEALLRASVTPSDATRPDVEWTAASPAVATVTDGVVKAVAPGTTTVTATTVDGGFKADCLVNVWQRVYPTALSTTETAIEIFAGVPYTSVRVVFTPLDTTETEVEWSSSDPDVATVSLAEDGSPVILGLSGGTAAVTVSSKSVTGVSASVAVTVKPTGSSFEDDNYGEYK